MIGSEEPLPKGEVVIYQGKPHWSVFFYAIMWFFAATVIYFNFSGLHVFIYFLILLGVIAWLEAVTRLLSSRLTITNISIRIRLGILRVQNIQIPLNRIESVEIDQNIIGKLLNYGTIILKGSGGTQETFVKIDAPMDFKRYAEQQLLKINAQRMQHNIKG